MGGYIKDYTIKFQKYQNQCHCVLFNYPYFLYYLREESTWLADTRSKANTCLHHAIFQEISPEKLGMHLLCTPSDPHVHISGTFLISVPRNTGSFIRCNILARAHDPQEGGSPAQFQLRQGYLLSIEIHRPTFDITEHNNGTVITFLIVFTNVCWWNPSSATHAVQFTTLHPISLRYLTLLSRIHNRPSSQSLSLVYVPIISFVVTE